MIPFARDEKDIGSHLNYFTGTLVYVPLSNVSLNKALDLIDCYSLEKPRYCSVGICAPWWSIHIQNLSTCVFSKLK